MLKFLVPALAVALALSPAQADVAIADEFVQTDFDIAGVTLGMAPEEAQKQLESRGYKAQENQMKKGPSFDDLVNIAAGKTQPNAIKSSWAQMRFNKGDESIKVLFKPLPSGNAVYDVSYFNKSPQHEHEEIQTHGDRQIRPAKIRRRVQRDLVRHTAQLQQRARCRECGHWYAAEWWQFRR